MLPSVPRCAYLCQCRQRYIVKLFIHIPDRGLTQVPRVINLASKNVISLQKKNILSDRCKKKETVQVEYVYLVT